MTAPLGRLVSVPLREVWPHEANDFTPWLAKNENLSLLAETLQLSDLQLQDTEVAVGSFYIDILARDIEGRMVVIENQFGPTDHTHLGQIMTYVAGQEGRATVIWIAEKFRDEHRAAIDWLNTATIEDFDFFAVEVEALRIADSPPAPWFNVVAKPNNWTRGVGRAARATASTPPNERQQSYIAYWSRFADFLVARNAPFKMQRSEFRGEWCSFGWIARRRFTLFVHVSLAGTGRRVALYAGHQTAFADFDSLIASRDEIDAEFGAKLDWKKNPRSVEIAVNRPDLASKPEEEQFAWFVDRLERFVGVFRPRVENMIQDTGGADALLPSVDIAAES
jgi:hypothetical protein